MSRGFPGSPVVKTPHFHSRGTGSIPVQGTRIPQTTQKIKESAAFQKEVDFHVLAWSKIAGLFVYLWALNDVYGPLLSV